MERINLSGGRPDQNGFAIVYPQSINYIRGKHIHRDFVEEELILDAIQYYIKISSCISTKYPKPELKASSLYPYTTLNGSCYWVDTIDAKAASLERHLFEAVHEVVEFLEKIGLIEFKKITSGKGPMSTRYIFTVYSIV